MLIAYINAAIARARYKIIEDGNYFGAIPGLRGVWASASTLEACREELQEVLEDWLVLKRRDSHEIPNQARVRLSTSLL